MKTANRNLIMISWLFAGFVAFDPASVLAGPAAAINTTNTPAMLAPGSVPSAPPAARHSSVAVPSASASSQMPSVSMPRMNQAATADRRMDDKIPDLSKPMPGNKKGDKKGDKKEASDKVPDSVREVIKHLSNKAEDITLDDLNAAREAIAKLDALIDIEKRLVDLDKIRHEREKEDDKRIAEALPKAALAPPPSFMPPPMPVERHETVKVVAPPAPVKQPPAQIDIISIEGSNNRYGALIRDNGMVRMVHAGDHLSDGTNVIAVTTQGVELERDKTTRIAQVRDVQAVFGDSP